MNAKTRRKLEMGARVLIFCRLQADPGTIYGASLARLEERLVRARQLALQERNGIIDSHFSAVRKRELVRTMRRGHLAHVRQVARIAALELPHIGETLRLQRGTIPYQTFRTVAGRITDVALTHRDVLLRYGLSEAVLDSLVQTLDEFDRVTSKGISGHLAHVGASADLDVVADEIVQIVKAMEGINRVRLATGSELWGAWQSASHVIATPRSKLPPAA
jgi:hypothetical protein